MNIIEQLNADEEIQRLKKQLYEATGEKILFNHDCYAGIDDYKEHLKECVKAGKVIIRPRDEQAMHRFDSIFKK